MVGSRFASWEPQRVHDPRPPTDPENIPIITSRVDIWTFLQHIVSRAMARGKSESDSPLGSTQPQVGPFHILGPKVEYH